MLCLPSSPAAIKPAWFSDRGEPCVENNAGARRAGEPQFVIVGATAAGGVLVDRSRSIQAAAKGLKQTRRLLAKINSTSSEDWQQFRFTPETFFLFSPL